MKIDTRLLKKMDFGLIVVVLLICIIGVVVVGSATYSLGSERYIKTQVISIVLGIMAIVVIMLFDYNTFAKMYVPIYIVCNAMLLAVFVFGKGSEDWGAQRWIRFGSFGFQPSDFAKIGIIICLAKMLDDNKDNLHRPQVIFKVLLFAGFPMVLILMQPDLGTTLIFASFVFGMLFVAGLKYKYILIAMATGVVLTPLAWFGVLHPYQRQRVFIFLNPEQDPLGDGYHTLQSRVAVGAGMIFGKGLFNGTSNQFGFLPEKHTDFIFSVVAEELGFLGVTVLILLYFIMLYKCIKIAREAKDDFGAYLVSGITFMIAFHIFLNIAMTIGLAPVTGKPLPFVSYGGTFMLTNMMALGLILNVNMRRDKINF
ncbi:rod shape-determining protein RodA [Alkaliphilus oremlandii]|uniref:Peptidoglycan glycosyltransferase RodA n=1 Tax=Alkaliphilus oremlandii (strain OhILAs) TaxID=350688 RepID=A8MIH8_ALKOO|nr:rod shape-determining protein RodA [Alkaliphilus oremlandii]ABW19610.1 rod shape-determining protein RodA [Alkaliphilus oremlandii OhILAs]